MSEFGPNQIVEPAERSIEIIDKSREFKEFIDTLTDFEKSWILVDQDRRSGYELASLFLELRPSISNPGAVGYKLADSSSRYFVAAQSLFDRANTLDLLKKRAAYFDDLDFERALDSRTQIGTLNFPQGIGALYLTGYLQSIKRWEASKLSDDITRAGLLNGYPSEAIVAYTQNRANKRYDRYGFTFLYDEADSEAIRRFDEKNERAFIESGLTEYIESFT